MGPFNGDAVIADHQRRWMQQQADVAKCRSLGHNLQAEDFGRRLMCYTCQPTYLVELITGMRKVRLGDPAPEGRGTPVVLSQEHAPCPSCGAPWEPGRCSYCLTVSR